MIDTATLQQLGFSEDDGEWRAKGVEVLIYSDGAPNNCMDLFFPNGKAALLRQRVSWHLEPFRTRF